MVRNTVCDPGTVNQERVINGYQLNVLEIAFPMHALEDDDRSMILNTLGLSNFRLTILSRFLNVAKHIHLHLSI